MMHNYVHNNARHVQGMSSIYEALAQQVATWKCMVRLFLTIFHITALNIKHVGMCSLHTTVDYEISSLKYFRQRPFPTKIKHVKYFV